MQQISFPIPKPVGTPTQSAIFARLDCRLWAFQSLSNWYTLCYIAITCRGKHEIYIHVRRLKWGVFAWKRVSFCVKRPFQRTLPQCCCHLRLIADLSPRPPRHHVQNHVCTPLHSNLQRRQCLNGQCGLMKNWPSSRVKYLTLRKCQIV